LHCDKSYNLNVDQGHVSACAQLAGKIGERQDVAAFRARFGEETVRHFEEVAWRRPMGELLNTRVTHANSRLARHCGLDVVGGESGRLELPADSPRGGLLTQGSVLTIGGDEASKVSRFRDGAFRRDRVPPSA
jgi:hypothetical protein